MQSTHNPKSICASAARRATCAAATRSAKLKGSSASKHICKRCNETSFSPSEADDDDDDEEDEDDDNDDDNDDDEHGAEFFFQKI